MNGTLTLFGRGLLVLALSGFAVACGDDDGGDDHDHDAGPDGGEAGSSGGGGGDDGGAGMGSDVTVSECVAMTDTNTMGGVTQECAMCACEEGLEETVACNATCWGLISCFGANCGDVDPSDMAAATDCVVANCLDVAGGAMNATPLGAILRSACADVCVTAPPEGDGGTDDGGA